MKIYVLFLYVSDVYGNYNYSCIYIVRSSYPSLGYLIEDKGDRGTVTFLRRKISERTFWGFD